MAFKSFSGKQRHEVMTHDRVHVPLVAELQHKPMLVDLTVEEGTRLKVLYGSQSGFHAVDLDSAR